MTDTMPRTGTPWRWRWPGFAGPQGRLGRAVAARLRRPAGAEDAAEFVFPLTQATAVGGEKHAGLGSGSRLCGNLDLYHDGDATAVRCACRTDEALAVSCGAFGGSYLSLVAAVPERLSARFGPGRMLRLGILAETSRPVTAFLRLNIGSADGHEVFYETLVFHRGTRIGEFDLDGVRLPFDGRLRAWADIIFARPEQSEIAISDLCMRLVGKDEL